MEFIDTELLGEATRWLSKSGEFHHAEELKKIAGVVTPEQAAELYCYFRDNSQRWESEWRNQFIGIFPSSESHLPEADGADTWQTKIFEIIDGGDLDAMKGFLGSIGTLSTEFDPATAFQEGQEMGFGSEADYLPFDVYPVQIENEDCVTAVDYARRRGHEKIAAYLESVIGGLESKWKAAYVNGYAAANGG